MLLLIGVLLLAVLSALRGAESSSSTGGSVQTLFDLIKADNVASFDEMVNFHFNGQLPSLRNAKGWTALHVAAYHGAEKVTEHLLNNENDGVSLIARNFLSETPLHLACLKNHVPIVEKLIQTAKSRQINMSTVLEAEQIEKRTPIFYVINSSSVDALNILFVEGVNLFQGDIYGMMPIHYAVANRHLEATNFILLKMPGNVAMQHGCICQQNVERTISHLAAEHDFVEFVEKDYDHLNFSAIDSLGQNPACWAAINGSIRLGEHMLRNSIDILIGNCVYGKNNEITGSPLHAAAYHRRREYVELLLRCEADEMTRDSSGGTVAHAMARQSSSTGRDVKVVQEILLLLRERNLLVFLSKDNRGRTPFHVATECSSLVFARLLDEHFAIDMSSVDNEGYSGLHLASSFDFLMYLLSMPKVYWNIDSRTVSVNKSHSTSNTKPGNLTVLMTAIKVPIPVISHLITLKADKDAVNDAGQTVVYLAVEENYLEAIDILVGFSFNFSARDNLGRTPLMYAIELKRTVLAIKIVKRFTRSPVLNDKTLDTLDSPLHLAVAKPSLIELVRQLIKDPVVNVSIVNVNSESVLHKAVNYLNVEAVKLLLAKGAASSLHVADVVYKRTPFHLVATWCNSMAIEIGKIMLPSLLANSNVLQLKDYKNDTPLDLAIRHNCVEMVDLIMAPVVALDSEACLKLNSQGLTPWHFAKTLGNELMADNMVRNGFCSNPVLPTSCEDALRQANIRSGTFKIHPVGQSPAVGFCNLPVDCEEIKKLNESLPSGIYTIYPPDRPSIEVYCDMTYRGGGWTVFQRRVDGSQDFLLKWADYKKGFGNLSANFWLGNDNIHAITSGQHEYNLLIALTAKDGATGVALYDGFRIEDEANFYTLRFKSFKENGGIKDSLTSEHKDMKFSTVDSDNDLSSTHCASQYKGG